MNNSFLFSFHIELTPEFRQLENRNYKSHIVFGEGSILTDLSWDSSVEYQITQHLSLNVNRK